MNDQGTFEDQPVAWRPTDDVIAKAQLTKFMDQIGVATWDELYDFSIRDIGRFTEEVLRFLEIDFDPKYTRLIDTADGIEWPKWCVGGGLNITETCVDRWAEGIQKSQPAVIWEDEEGEVRRVSYKLLLAEVEAVSASMRRRGIGKGDAVGVHLPMMIETVVAMIAIGRIGAIAIPVFSGYGVDAISSRLNAVGAKALFTCDGFPRRGKEFNAFEVATAAVAESPTVRNVFIVTRLQSGAISWNLPGVDVEFYDLDLVGEGEQMRLDDPEAFATASATERTSAEDPLIVLYTSGTTGKPKGIAHTHCGFPIKAAQDMAFGTDVGAGTRISWVTDIGWMMGPWLIYGALINGGTIVIYDGAPDYPNADRMWEVCAKHKVEILGISPTLVRTLAAKGDDLPKQHDLSHLRAFASTGEPWNPAPWRWLFEKVGDSKLPIINYSGGTEISGGILMGNPLLPIKPCSFPAPCPGMEVAVLDESGDPATRGKVGELAIRQPWIGMARGFWHEPERYIETYWSRFDKIWVHGDWAMQDADGHWYILGRSDDTLKVGGKRVGPAEVESLLVAHPDVTEAAVIGVPDEMKGTAMVAFCVLPGNESVGPKLEADLKKLVAKDMGKPLAPSRIHFVGALPKTRNAKVMRRVIRAAYLGEDAGDLSALENPQAVDGIRRAKE